MVAILLLFLAAACTSSGVSAPSPTSTAAPEPTVALVLTPSFTPEPAFSPSPTAVPTPTPVGDASAPGPPVSGFLFPIEGACIPTSDNLIPNAPRPYRAGVHEGIDFYPGLACANIALDTPVLAAKDGQVIRADRDFVEMTPAELQELLDRSQSQGYTDPEALDRFRGRQVWIDHGGGVVTRYAHLDGIAPGIEVGTWVRAGQVVGYVGNSGTPEAVTDPDAGLETHLHFEIWVGDSYLGEGLPPDQVRSLLEQAFQGP